MGWFDHLSYLGLGGLAAGIIFVVCFLLPCLFAPRER